MASTSRFRFFHVDTLLRYFDFLGTEGKTYTLPDVDASLAPLANPLFTGTVFLQQGAPTAKTQAATLTAAELLSGIITTNAADDAADDYTLPTAADLDTALPAAVAGTAFDFSLINIGTNANEDATIVTADGWTLVGEMTVESNDADRARSSGRFRARKTAAGAWTLYRIA